MSFASLIPGFGFPLTAEEIAESPELLVVAAAANSGNDNNHVRPEPFTLDLPNVLCVAATDEHDELAQFVPAFFSEPIDGNTGTNRWIHTESAIPEICTFCYVFYTCTGFPTPVPL